MIICIDVQCPSGHTHEVFINNKVKTTECPQEGCNEVAERIISPVRCNLDPCSGDFPGATIKWSKNREQKMAQERKTVENHGSAALWDVDKR